MNENVLNKPNTAVSSIPSARLLIVTVDIAQNGLFDRVGKRLTIMGSIPSKKIVTTKNCGTSPVKPVITVELVTRVRIRCNRTHNDWLTGSMTRASIILKPEFSVKSESTTP